MARPDRKGGSMQRAPDLRLEIVEHRIPTPGSRAVVLLAARRGMHRRDPAARLK
jgi:hypothetical protein